MTQHDNTNRGAVWPNDRMRDGKQDPDFTGSINVDGVEYWLNGWKRKPGAKANAPMISFAVNRKDQNRAPRPSYDQPPTPPPSDDWDF